MITRNFLLILIFFVRIPGLTAQNIAENDSVQATIVLIGDAGQLINGRQPVVDAARKKVAMNANTTVIYLGDNLYKTGLPDDALPTYEIAKAPLDSQILIAGKAPVNVIFIPGNHDWANGSRNGFQSILRVQNYIDVLGNKYVRQLPRNGCPGPVEVKINDDVTLVVVDSQWWLQAFDKPGVESDCPYKTKAEVLTQLEDIFAKNDDKFVIFAMHHPIRSYGPHGGYFKIKQHIFPFTDAKPKLYIPLPIIGSAYPLTRAVFGTEQDLKHPFYQQMIGAFEGAVKGHPNVIFVSGHEHTLQLIEDSNYVNIVSGSGSKSNRVSKSRNTTFASPDYGFATLSVLKNKTVRSTFYTVNGEEIKEAFSKNILDFSKIKKLKSQGDTTREPEFVFKDSAVISASDKYKNETNVKNSVLGKNYRREWSTPVTFKVFNLRKEKGGFKITGIGGGKQTKSLKLEDRNGKEWVLRTIDKDPEKAVPENLRGTIGQAIVVDVISASSPYAPYIIPILAEAVGVPAANPRFFFVPDDPAFGYYRPLFANTVCMLEERQPTPDETDTKSTNSIINKMFEDNVHHIDQSAVLKARLLDMLIGDFDRHADQWRWGTKDTGKGKVYYPVPKDRDQAFFNSNGL
ncbi:MAG: metallophosphoesterase [Ferruginibacter sp.]|nr:metallophosphoesterase [Ferruginibacter sp.]